jgi:uncharacterized small protein (DUF1192 family)
MDGAVPFRMQTIFDCGCVVRHGEKCSSQDAPDGPDCPLDSVRIVGVIRRRIAVMESEIKAMDAEIARRRGVLVESEAIS